MKTTIKICIAALVIASFGFEGCKKGENDPFISLRTRKARMAGDWKVSAGSGTDVNGSTTTTWTYDGAIKSETTGSNTSTTNITMTMTFEKDGTFTTVETTTASNFSFVDTEKGTWNFTAGVGDAKSKDHIVMRTTSSVEVTTIFSVTSTNSDTWTGDDAPASIMYIDQLKNKEIIMKWNGTTSNGSTSSSTGSYTLTPQ